jgi:ribosome-associated protein
MDIRKLQRAIVDGLEDVKAHNIVVFNTEHLSPLFERVIIASGTSNRQTRSLASSVRDAVKSSGQQVLRTEGEENGEWIIVDCGAAVAHIMQPGIREYYHLEELWGGKPVKMKIADEVRALPKAAPVDDVPKAGRSGRPSTKKAAAPAPRRATNVDAGYGATAAPRRAAARSTAKPSTAAKAPVRKAVASKPLTSRDHTLAGKPAAKAAGSAARPSAKPTAKSTARPTTAKPTARPTAKKAVSRSVTRTTGVKAAAPKSAAKAAPPTKTAAKTATKKAAVRKPAGRG